MKNPAKKIIFINTHPIQYFAPLYAYCNKRGLKVEAWYCSDESIRGEKDMEFGKAIKWDIPLLEGYPHRFFKNYSWKPSINNGFLGVINLGVIKALFKEPKSVVVVHGWGYATALLVMIFGKIAGHTICFRGETPIKQEKLHSASKLFLRKILLQNLMFRLIDKFLIVGKQNGEFYRYYGVKDKNMIFIPYAVDNERFDKAYQELKGEKERLREKLGIPPHHFVILFSGKYISKKRPLDLVKAFHLLKAPHTSLVMVGEGELRRNMEQYISENKVPNVYLTGFINQSLIPAYYAIGDVFVMCSQEGETWGLSVNEAMNFALPVVASDLVGCTDDLISNGENGFVYKCGDIEGLKTSLQFYLANYQQTKVAGEKSKGLIRKYSYHTIFENLSTINLN